MSLVFRGKELVMNEYLVELQAILDQYNVTEAWCVESFSGSSTENIMMFIATKDATLCKKVEAEIVKTFGEDKRLYIREACGGLPPPQSFVMYKDGKFYNSSARFKFS